MRIARQWSLCSDDAQDAYQRALEIYLRRVDSLDPTTEAAWLKVVVKHEAMAVRRSRQESVTPEEVDFDTHIPTAQRSTEDRFESSERVARSAEVIRRLKPDEARALMLKAEGLSYEEIGTRLHWSYTKVNRCITEGRRRFLALYEQLETGAECERIAPMLAALVRGGATSQGMLELRPHLRNCVACRATVRKLHASRWQRLAGFLPFPAIAAPIRTWLERTRDGGVKRPAPAPDRLHPLERAQDLDDAFRRMNAGETALPIAVEHAGRLAQQRSGLRAYLEAALQRLQSSDLAVSLHVTTAGGGRAASIAALLGVCVSGVGAGTYCVATALLPEPKPLIHHAHVPPPAPAIQRAKLVRLEPAAAAVVATATPHPTRVRKRSVARPTPVSPSPKVTQVSHEQAPVSPAPAGARDFSFEQSAAPAPTQPAAAPATGGGEFTP